MRHISFLLAFVATVIAGCGGTSPVVIDFDDLTTIEATPPGSTTPQKVNLGQFYEVGTVFTENTTGVEIVVLEFQWLPQPQATPPKLAEWHSGGSVEIVKSNEAGGSGNEVHFDNACLGIIAPTATTLTELTVKFADLGGNINLIENGNLHNSEDFTSITSPTASGVKVLVTPGSGSLGTLKLSGTMAKFKFPGPIPPALENKVISAVVGGGQELWIDDIEFSQ